MPKPPTAARQELGFQTTNNAQAFALTLAGFEPRIMNRYTPELLQKLGCTARQAWEAGKPGIVEYYFEPAPGLKECITAYDEEAALHAAAKDGSTLEVQATDIVRIVAATLCQRKPFADLWKRVVPHLTIHKEGAPQRVNEDDGVSFRMVYPGFATISINDTAALERIGA